MPTPPGTVASVDRAEGAGGMVDERGATRRLRSQRVVGGAISTAGLVLLGAAVWLSAPPRPTLSAAAGPSSAPATVTLPVTSTVPPTSAAPIRLPVPSTARATTTKTPATTPPATKAPVSVGPGPIATKPTAPATAPPTTTRPAPTTVVLGEADNGRTISLRTGDRVEVHLTVCAVCGDTWKLSAAPSPEVIRYDGESDRPAAPRPGGAPAKQQVFSFTVIAGHTTSLVISYYPAGASTSTRDYQ